MKRKIMFWISVLFQIAQIVAVLMAFLYVRELNMLPDRYMKLFCVALLSSVLLAALLMFVPGKKPPYIARRVIAWLIIALTVIGCVIVSNVVSKVENTVQTITTTIVSEETRTVFVLKDDQAQTLQDASGYIFGYVVGYDEEKTAKALDVINDELGSTVLTQGYTTVFEMVDGLYSGQIQALILNSGYISILELYPEYENFADKTRILYTAKMEIIVATEPQETEPPTTVPETTIPQQTEPVATEEPNATNTPFVVYISGSDSRSSNLQAKTRSDVNILAVVNPETHQVLLLNTPRDYYVENPAGGGAMDKLTHCGVYGIDCSMEALENLYDINIDYYAKINFTGFETLVDAVGGVTVYADQSFSAVEGYYFSAGENFLDGKAALSFARERYHVSGGDRGRGKNQMKVITAVIKKMTSGTTVISNYSGILSSLEGMFATSFPMEDVSLLVKMQLDEMPSWEIHSFAVSGRTGSDINYSMPGMRASVMYQNEELVNQATELVNKVMAGERITQSDLKTNE